MAPKKTLTLLLLLCSSSHTSSDIIEKSSIMSGTTAILISTSDIILIAADTKQAEFSNGRIIGTDTVCKITEKDNIVYALAGYTESTNPHISVDKVIYDVKFQKKTFEGKLFEIDSILKPVILQLATLMKNHQPDLFFEASKKEQFVSLILASFENEKPIFALLVYKISDVNSQQISISQTLRMNSDSIGLFCIGRNEAVKIALESKGSISGKYRTYEEFLNGLIELQSKISPDEVGMPADIVKISATKTIWIQKTQKCKQ